MSRITKIITPDGKVTTIKQTSSCGCVTVLAAIVVIFGPAAWFGAWAIPAYVFLALVLAGSLGVQIHRGRRPSGTPAPTTPPAPPARQP